MSMSPARHAWKVSAVVLAAALGSASAAPHPLSAPGALDRLNQEAPFAVFVSTPPAVVEGMMDLAQIGPNDVVYDLGCGDGRIVIAAGKRGARGVGIEIDPKLVKEATENAQKNNVAGRVTIVEQDLFQADFSDATVVVVYLLPSMLMKLRPVFWKTLKPGSRVVSHSFDMGDWKPERSLKVEGRTIYLWTITPDLAAKVQ